MEKKFQRIMFFRLRSDLLLLFLLTFFKIQQVKPTTGPSASTDTTAVSPRITSNPQFTRNPQSVYHVSSGSTARLVWDHYVENRIANYLAYTMRWSLHDRNGGTVVIGVFTGSKFVTSKDCPARLRGRVSKESTATLVISNVTTADSGIYSFHLRWRSIDESNVKSLARLIVTDKPEIDVVQSNNTVSSYKGGTIRLYCLARGVPSPLFTWFDPLNQSIAAEAHNVTGGSLLTINPDSYGLYRCRAENILGYDEHVINVTQTGPEPSSTNRARKTNDHLMSMTSVLVMWHFLIESAFDS